MIKYIMGAIVHDGSLSHCHGLLAALNRTQPKLIWLEMPVISLIWQVKMSAVKKACSKVL